VGRGIWFGVFHAVSAFCNAGFALFTDNMMPFRNDIMINFAIASLIVLGGIGFTVILELYEQRSFRNLSLHSRMALTVSGLLILGGAVLIFIFETNTPGSGKIAYHGFFDRALSAVFQSVSARTAGFNTIDIGAMSQASLFLIIILMFIGASPGGTGGGIKTTTFGSLLAAMSAIVRGERDVTFFNRRLSHDLLLRAFTIALLSLSLVAAVTLVCVAMGKQSFMDTLFEVTSAFGTVGLIAGITADLSTAQKALIIITMFCGRLGPLTMAMALASSAQRKQYRLPAEEILIG
jgi:trk system potassium uptake protein TrkH